MKKYELDISDAYTTALLESDAYRQNMLMQEVEALRVALGIPQDERLVIGPWVLVEPPTIWNWLKGLFVEPELGFQIEREGGDTICLPRCWFEDRGMSAILNYEQSSARFIGAKVKQALEARSPSPTPL